MPHAIPLIGDPSWIQGTILFLQEYGERAIIFFRVDTKDGLLVQSFDPWRKAFAVHGEGSKIRVRNYMDKSRFAMQLRLIFSSTKILRCVSFLDGFNELFQWLPKVGE